MKRFNRPIFKIVLVISLLSFLFQGIALATTAGQIAIQNKGSFSYKAAPGTVNLSVKGSNDSGTTWFDLSSTTDVTWTSSDTNIATVSNGVVTFKGAVGLVTIIANAGGITDTVSTTVTATTSISGNFVYSSTPVQLRFIDTYTDGSTKDIPGTTWTSSNTNVAVVDYTGKVTFRNKQGAVTITATSGSKTDSVTTTVPFQSYKITPSTTMYTSSSPVQLTFSAVNYDGTTVPMTSGVSWSVSPTSIASIDSTGKLSFTGLNGTITISAEYLGNTTSSVATVNIPKTLTSLTITNPTPLSYSGTPVTLQVRGDYTDGTNAVLTSGLTWTSSNANVATVSSTGVVSFTGKNGDVTITAKSGTVSTSVSTTVNNTVASSLVISGSFVYSATPVTLTAMDGSTVLSNVVWSISDPSIAIVNNGVVTFTGKNGTVTITASYGDKVANISTSVNQVAASLVIKGSLVYTTATIQLSAEVTWPDGKKQTITGGAWSSSNIGVATISNTGQLTYTGISGPLTVSFTYANQTASLSANIVNYNQVTDLKINQSLYYSATPITLSLTGTLANGVRQTVPNSSAVWTSSDPSIASVYNGVVTYTGKNGPLTITATYQNKVATQSVNVNSTIVLSYLRINETLAFSLTPVTLSLTGTLINGQTISAPIYEAVWTTSDPTIATVSNGVVTYTGKNGVVTITASYGNKTTSVSANIVGTLSALAINQTLTYSPTPVTLTITGTLANGTMQNVTNAVWTTNNPAVATVSNGVVTFTGTSGYVTITATYGGKSASVSATVTSQSGNPFSTSILNKTTIENNILLKIRNTPGLNAIPNYKDTTAHWANREIKIAKKLDLVLGYSDNTFKPDNNVTRAEFVIMVSRMFSILPNNYGSNSFSDISNHYAKGYIIALNNLGVIGGYSDRTFKPDDEITRAEVVAILSKLIDTNQVPSRGSTYFYDTNQHWAASAINRISSIGLISGRGNSQFAPDDNTTRAEAVSLLLRTLSLDTTIKASLDAL